MDFECESMFRRAGGLYTCFLNQTLQGPTVFVELDWLETLENT